jgi:hypothetical protein
MLPLMLQVSAYLRLRSPRRASPWNSRKILIGPSATTAQMLTLARHGAASFTKSQMDAAESKMDILKILADWRAEADDCCQVYPVMAATLRDCANQIEFYLKSRAKDLYNLSLAEQFTKDPAWNQCIEFEQIPQVIQDEFFKKGSKGENR